MQQERLSVRAAITENESHSDELNKKNQQCSGINNITACNGTVFLLVGHECLDHFCHIACPSTDLKSMRFCSMTMFSQLTARFPSLEKQQLYKSFTITGLEKEVNIGGAQKPSKVMTFRDSLDCLYGLKH